MASINANVRRFENGGIIMFTDGATTYDNILNVVAGSISWNAAMREAIEYKDRGVLQVPLEGDDMASDVEVTVHAGEQVAAGLMTILVAAGTAGLKKLFTNLIIKIPNFRGDATGESFTWASAYIPEPPQYKTGEKLDTITFKFRALSGPVIAAY